MCPQDMASPEKGGTVEVAPRVGMPSQSRVLGRGTPLSEVGAGRDKAEPRAHRDPQHGCNGAEQPRPPSPASPPNPSGDTRCHQVTPSTGWRSHLPAAAMQRGWAPSRPLAPALPAAPTGTHHLSQFGLQVSLLHAQLLVGLDHLLQLLLPLFALLQLPRREVGMGGQLGDPPHPPVPLAPLTSCWNWLSCCCSDAFSLLSSDVSLAS